MFKREHKLIVIVDGYSTGRELVAELLERNVECLHVQSTPELPALVAKCFDPSPYDANLGYLGSVETVIDVLSPLRPDAVVAGSEWGVTFAEQVAAGMGLPTNCLETRAARRDKYEMIEAVRARGLRAAEQAVVSDIETARIWARRHGAWPIVVKPLASAGSDGVSLCNGPADIDRAVARALRRENIMGGVNDRLLMQSYLTGPQFIVNTVSHAGRHYVTDVWRMTLSTLSGIGVAPGELYLLDPTQPVARMLIDYTLRVLDALGIENGAAHSELKWTPNGPTLIETGARLMGAAMDRPSYRAAGAQTQASAYATLLAGCEAEREALLARRHYAAGKNMAKLFFNFRRDGEVRCLAGLARLRELPSFHAHYRPLAKGARVWRTMDTLACGGIVYLVHADRRQVVADVERIRAWELEDKLYDIAPSPTLVEQVA